MSECIVCKKKSRYTINRGTESEVKLCSNHYTNQSHLKYPRQVSWTIQEGVLMSDKVTGIKAGIKFTRFQINNLKMQSEQREKELVGLLQTLEIYEKEMVE